MDFENYFYEEKVERERVGIEYLGFGIGNQKKEKIEVAEGNLNGRNETVKNPNQKCFVCIIKGKASVYPFCQRLHIIFLRTVTLPILWREI